MAYIPRTIAQIKQQIIDQIAASPVLSGLTSPSVVAEYNSWEYIIAVCQNLFEQLVPPLETEVTAIIANLAPGTPIWMQQQMFKFQYSSTDPQYVFLDANFNVQYPNINTALQIIKACSVITTGDGTLSVRVAKGTTLTALSATEILAAKSFLSQIDFAGIVPTLLSANPDRLYVVGDVYYDAQFPEDVVLTNIQVAFNAYLAGLNPGGSLAGETDNNDIIAAIRAAAGVKDFVPEEIWGRPSTEPLGDTKCIEGYDVLLRKYTTFAGYVIPEDSSGNTLADKLTFYPV